MANKLNMEWVPVKAGDPSNAAKFGALGAQLFDSALKNIQTLSKNNQYKLTPGKTTTASSGGGGGGRRRKSGSSKLKLSKALADFAIALREPIKVKEEKKMSLSDQVDKVIGSIGSAPTNQFIVDADKKAADKFNYDFGKIIEEANSEPEDYIDTSEAFPQYEDPNTNKYNLNGNEMSGFFQEVTPDVLKKKLYDQKFTEREVTEDERPDLYLKRGQEIFRNTVASNPASLKYVGKPWWKREKELKKKVDEQNNRKAWEKVYGKSQKTDASTTDNQNSVPLFTGIIPDVISQTKNPQNAKTPTLTGDTEYDQFIDTLNKTKQLLDAGITGKEKDKTLTQYNLLTRKQSQELAKAQKRTEKEIKDFGKVILNANLLGIPVNDYPSKLKQKANAFGVELPEIKINKSSSNIDMFNSDSMKNWVKTQDELTQGNYENISNILNSLDPNNIDLNSLQTIERAANGMNALLNQYVKNNVKNISEETIQQIKDNQSKINMYEDTPFAKTEQGQAEINTAKSLKTDLAKKKSEVEDFVNMPEKEKWKLYQQEMKEREKKNGGYDNTLAKRIWNPWYETVAGKSENPVIDKLLYDKRRLEKEIMYSKDKETLSDKILPSRQSSEKKHNLNEKMKKLAEIDKKLKKARMDMSSNISFEDWYKQKTKEKQNLVSQYTEAANWIEKEAKKDQSRYMKTHKDSTKYVSPKVYKDRMLKKITPLVAESLGVKEKDLTPHHKRIIRETTISVLDKQREEARKKLNKAKTEEAKQQYKKELRLLTESLRELRKQKNK